MSAKIKMREIDSLRGIMASCLKVVDHENIFTHRYHQSQQRKIFKDDDSFQSTHFKTFHRENYQKEPQKKVIKSVQFKKPSFLDQSQDVLKIRKDKYKSKFCGNVVLSKINKPTFKNVVLKYRRNYHPTNASKGSQDTSNQRVRQPKKVRLFQQQIQEQSQSKKEIRRMAVLSQVIAENNRRGLKLFREKSNKRHKTEF